MANFEVRKRDSQKVVLVNGNRYTHTVTISQNQTTSRYGDKKVDNFRHNIVNVDRFAVTAYPKCDNTCGASRDESITVGFVVAAGQEPTYYARKAAMLKEMAAVLTQASTDITRLGNGGELNTAIAVVAAS